MLRVLGYLKRNKKGQGLTEYVLILAFIAGVAFMMFGGEGSLKGTVVSTFDKTIEILASINSSKSNYYAEHFGEYHTKNRSELQALDNTQRVDVDLSALQNIADGLIGKDISWILETFPASESYQDGRGDDYATEMLLGQPGRNPFTIAQNVYEQNDSGQRGAIRDGTYGSSTKNNPEIISLIHGSAYDNSDYRMYTPNGTGTWSKESYFYSDGMIGTGGRVTSNINVTVSTGSDGKVNGARVWVSGGNSSLLNSGTGTNGTTLAQGVTSGAMSQ